MTESSKARTTPILIRFILGLCILTAVVAIAGPASVVRTLQEVTWSPLILSMLLMILSFVLSAAGLILLFPDLPRRDRLPAALGFLRVTSITLLLPGRLSDLAFVKAYAPWGNPGTILGRVLAHRMLSTVYLVVIAFAGGLWLLERRDWLWAVVGTVVAGIAALVVLIRLRPVRAFIKQRILRRYAAAFAGFYAAFQSSFPGRPPVTAAHAVVSLARFAAMAVSTALVFQACGTKIGAHVTLVGNSIGALAGIVPTTMLGLGVQEMIGVGYYGLFGLAASAIVAAYLAGRVRSVLVLGLFAALWLWPDRSRAATTPATDAVGNAEEC
jgi:hypothetical protein